MILLVMAFLVLLLDGVGWFYLSREYPGKYHRIYMFVSAVTAFGMGCWLHFYHHLENLIVLKYVTLFIILAVTAYTDYKEKKMPNKVLLFGLEGRIFFYGLEIFFHRKYIFLILKSDGAALGIIFIFFLIAHFIVKNGVGMGDIKLIFLMSLYLGVQGIFGALFMSLCVIFVVALVLLVTKRKTKNDYLPFAPAIFLGTLLSMLING